MYFIPNLIKCMLEVIIGMAELHWVLIQLLSLDSTFGRTSHTLMSPRKPVGYVDLLLDISYCNLG